MSYSLLTKLTELDQKAAQAEELRQELRRSILLQDLWPDVFEHGSTTSWVSGHASRELRYTIKRGDGSKRTFDLTMVPLALWPEEVIQHIKRYRGKYYTHLLVAQAEEDE